MTQILRTWTCWIHVAIEDKCRRNIEQEILPHVRLAPGNQRASVLFKDARDGTIEVVVLSVWDSLEHIKAFYGPNYRQPMIPPTHVNKMFDRDAAVRHYVMSKIPPALRDWTVSGRTDQET